jgi:hypothetical protein
MMNTNAKSSEQVLPPEFDVTGHHIFNQMIFIILTQNEQCVIELRFGNLGSPFLNEIGSQLCPFVI